MSFKSNELKLAFSKAAALCSRMEKSPKAIKRKLQLWGLEDADINTVIEQLFEHNFLNEQRFANSYVRDKYRFNKWGRTKIAHYLNAEEINTSCIEEAMLEINEEEYLSILSELLREKRKKVKAQSDYELKMKVARFAQGRGFEPNIIFREYDKL